MTISRELADQGQEIVFVISDTGIGVAPDMIEDIFEDFAQADSSINREYGGAGLGLAISRGLARGLGGDITATSVPGEGSVFTLRLPAVIGEDQTPAFTRNHCRPAGAFPESA